MAPRTTTRTPSAATRKANATQAANDPAKVPAVLRGVTTDTKPATTTRTRKPVATPKANPSLGDGKLATTRKAPAKATKAAAPKGKLASTPAPSPLIDTKKQAAKRQLAFDFMNAAMAFLATIPADHPAVREFGRADAQQLAVNWVHHLPVCDPGETWPFVTVPVPQRSNWDGNIRL